MSFWTTSEGKSATDTTGKFESGGGIALIPENTTCLAMITEAKIDEYQGDEYVSLTWTVAKPQAYQNRKVFQKVRIFDADSKKADKAKQMLAAIDKNAGGSLAKSDTAPSNTTLFGIMKKPMLIKVMVWELNDKTGNWVAAVSPRSVEEPVKVAPKAVSEIANDDIDEIPF
jgi:hypothetical protein